MHTPTGKKVSLRHRGKVIFTGTLLYCSLVTAEDKSGEISATSQPPVFTSTGNHPPGFENLTDAANNQQTSPVTAKKQKNSQFVFPDEPPEGFADLLASQTNQIDVYFSNQLVSSVLSEFDTERLTFKDPEAIVAAIENILKPEIILKALNKPLPLNTKYVCKNQTDDNCALFNPAVVGIVFNEAQFRADLYINPVYLKKNSIRPDEYLPEPDKAFSTIHRYTFDSKGGDNIASNYSATLNSVFASGRHRLHSQINSTEETGIRLEGLLFEQDSRKWRGQIGTLNSHGLLSPLIKTREFFGFSASRVLDLRADLKLSTGSKIFLFLNERSRVSVYRNEKLLDVRFYDAGNQQLDTSRMPDGAYLITVVIEQTGKERREEHFFNRSTLLPPANHAMHFLEAGHYIDQTEYHSYPQTTDSKFIHLGSRLRIKNNLGTEFQFSAGNKQAALLQTGLYHFRPGLLAYASLLAGEHSSQGYSANISWQIRNTNFFFSQQSLKIGAIPADSTETDALLFDGNQSSVSITRPFSKGNLNLRYNRRKFESRDSQFMLDLSYRSTFIHRSGWRSGLEISYRKTDADDSFLLQFNLYKSDGNQQKMLAGKWNNIEEDSAQIEGRMSKPLFATKPALAQQTIRLKADQQENWNANWRLDMNSRSSSGYLETQYNSEATGAQKTYSTELRGNLFSSGRHFQLSGKSSGNAAVMVNVVGPENSRFDVKINNQIRRTIASNQLIAIPLRPYHRYNVELISRSTELLKLDSLEQRITLLPGNVRYLDWKITPVVAVVGQAKYPDGNLVKHAKISNLEEFSTSDDNGWFQVEITNERKLHFVPVESNPACTITLPEIDQDEDVVVLEELVCIPK